MNKMDLINPILIFLTGIVSGFIGGITSGGGGLFSIPVLIFLGLSPQIAIGTQRLGSSGYVISTIYKFFKEKKIIWTYIIPLSIISPIGAYLGASTLLNIDKNILLKIVGIVIAVFLPVILFRKNLGVERRKKPKALLVWLGFFVYFLLSIYDGFLGVAGGVLIAYLFVFIFGLTFIESNATEKIPYALNLTMSLVIFAMAGVINYVFGLALFAGELIGGYFGAHYAVKKGEKTVKAVFALVAIFLAVKLIFFS